MAVTAFGPQGPNFSLVRPATDPIASTGDSWFKPCSAPGATDGTMITASWLNMMIAQLRTVVVAAGITLDDTDDDMLRNAITAMIGGGGGDGFSSTPITVI